MPSPPELPQSLYHLFAPLPVPMSEHLLLRLARRNPGSIVKLWDILIAEMEEKRREAYFYMNSYVELDALEHKHLSTSWLLEALSIYAPERKRLPASTLSYWARRGILRYVSEGKPDPSSAAALLIARMIDPGERNFLPAKIEVEKEPLWWCRAETIDHRGFPCPVPLPTNLEASTLLWTNWPGAAWDPLWMRIGDDLGAIRWAGATVQKGDIQWTITLDELEVWMPHLVQSSKFSELAQMSVKRQVTQDIAHLALRLLAMKYIGSGYGIEQRGSHE